MSRVDCPRAWEAQAIEDGRLREGDRASFERHRASCASCTAEVQSLAGLRDAMARLPEPARTPLQRRAQRVMLLRRANGAFFAGARDRAKSWPAVAIACAALLAIAVFGIRRVATAGSEPLSLSSAPTLATHSRFEVTDVSHAVWRADERAHVVRITLERGIAGFHVAKVAAADRFYVELPDGEIEVHGTRFVVDVAAGATRSVDVTEGVVSLRVHDVSSTLRAGQRWTTPANLGAADSTPKPAQPPAMVSIANARPIAAARKTPPPAPAAAPSSAATSAAVTSDAPSASARYGAATAAYRAGAYASADALLASFLAEFPRDQSSEDASFLRAAAHERLGDVEGAASLARDYLARYPAGFRRPEAERIAARH